MVRILQSSCMAPWQVKMANGEFNFQVHQRNWFSLRGSEMFIDSGSNSIIRAPAERNVSVIGTWRPNYVSLRWSEENFLRGRAFYKHLAPNGAKSNNVLLHSGSVRADGHIICRQRIPGRAL